MFTDNLSVFLVGGVLPIFVISKYSIVVPLSFVAFAYILQFSVIVNAPVYVS